MQPYIEPTEQRVSSERGYLFQTQQITRLFRHEHFRISFEETFHPSKRIESCRVRAGVMDSKFERAYR